MMYNGSRRVATYVDRIRKGGKPADPPAVQPTRFKWMINRKTAKTSGIKALPTRLVLAHTVIE